MAARETYSGLLAIYKPAGMSSHDAVQEVRKLTRQQKIGHAGTLDPLAEGLLILCLGRATKIVQFLVDHDKTYEATIRLGQRSRTYDAEGLDENEAPNPVPDFRPDRIMQLLGQYCGTHSQRVPVYSAVRVNGQRLYKAARRGEEIEAPVREVHISYIRLVSYDKPDLRIQIRCSKGTYIRSLAHDIGERIGCGAYLKSLKRTAIGSLRVDGARTLEEIRRMAEAGLLQKSLLPIEEALHFAAVWVSDRFREFVVQGKPLMGRDVVKIDGAFSAGENIVLKDRAGVVLAVGTAEADWTRFRPETQESLFHYVRVLN